MSRYLKLFIALFIVLIISILIRSLFEQKYYITVAQKQEGLEAIKSYEKVILFHFPFSPYTDIAIDNLLKICISFKNSEKKLYCYETLRSAIIQIRNLHQPYEDIIESINPEIAKLRTRLTIDWDKEELSKNKFNEIYDSHIILLRYGNAPTDFWSLIAVVSLICWISFVIYSIYINKILGMIGFVFFFILWIIGLYLA